MELIWLGMTLLVVVLGIRAWWRLRRVRSEAREDVQADVARLEAEARPRPRPRHRRLPPPPPNPGETGIGYAFRTGHHPIPSNATEREENILQRFNRLMAEERDTRPLIFATVRAEAAAGATDPGLRRQFHDLLHRNRFYPEEARYICEFTIDNPEMRRCILASDVTFPRLAAEPIAIPAGPAPNNFRQIDLEPRDGE